MSNWKIQIQPIQIHPHPNAESLELGIVGDYQVVVQKGQYKNGEQVLFAPEKSILTGQLREEFAKYLKGPNKDRVGSVHLRGELSQGILIPKQFWPEDWEGDDIDLPAYLGITKYVPEMPKELLGDTVFIPQGVLYKTHDCNQLAKNEHTLSEKTIVTVSEKIHGTQGVYILDKTTGNIYVTSKGRLDKGLCFAEGVSNIYTQALDNPLVNQPHTLREAIVAYAYKAEDVLQVVAEVVPCQKGFTYGLDKPTAIPFRIIIDGYTSRLPAKFRSHVLYSGPYTKEVKNLRNGMETISRHELHIREGIVIQPWGTAMYLKYINPEYKETGEELN
jgi:RNA ligase (TIGR02306 family)